MRDQLKKIKTTEYIRRDNMGLSCKPVGKYKSFMEKAARDDKDVKKKAAKEKKSDK